MVTVQSEDSNISWETSFNPAASSAAWMQPADRYGSARHAGNIIFIMDDVHTVRKKRTKRKAKEKAAQPPPPPELSPEEMDESVNRPAMVEVATPNVKDEQHTQQGVANETDSSEQKERRLFRLISESTEILNIVVPPKVVTVDEEESKTLEDHLAYMEDTPILHPSDVEQCPDDLYTSEPATEPGAATHKSQKGEPQEDIPPVSPFQPPPTNGPTQDYCNVFTYDRQSTEAADKEEEEEDEGGKPDEEVSQDAAEQAAPEQSVKEAEEETANDDPDYPVLSGEFCSDLLDDVFYGGTEEGEHPEPEMEMQKVRTESTRSSSRKASGSVLFEEEDDVLTPIYLPEGPPKIIDQILLEEPKAMAFLYTDLYEEAVGTRTKDDDALSQTSEKSFHSQQSDREDKGYLEKFLLTVDGPPMPQAEEKSDPEAVPIPSSAPMKEDGKLWPEDVVELAELGPPPEEEEEEHATAHAEEEEVTDFLRDSNTSSPFEMVEKADVEELEESSTVENNRVRQVTFKEVTAESEQAEEEASTHDDVEQHLDATVLAELEDLHGKEKPVSDDKVLSSGNKGMVGQQNTAETPVASSTEPKSIDNKPIRPFLELSTLEPVGAAEGMMAECMVVIEKGEEEEKEEEKEGEEVKEGEEKKGEEKKEEKKGEEEVKEGEGVRKGEEEVKTGDLQTESCKEEGVLPVAEGDEDVVLPPDNVTDVAPANVAPDIVQDVPSDSVPVLPTANDVPDNPSDIVPNASPDNAPAVSPEN